MRGIVLWVLILGLMVTACTPGYRAAAGWNPDMGYKEQQLDGAFWRVSYVGNGYTTRESAQTYWLYRCAELTIEQGFDGFEILSHMPFSEQTDQLIRLAASAPVVLPIYGGHSRGGLFSGDIHLLKKPFDADPPRIYDAAELKKTLAVYVTGESCSMGNVCHHAHSYLYPLEASPAKSATQQ